jgi:hypothetical protein
VIYPQLLKTDFDRMPAILRDLHTRRGTLRAAGSVTVQHHHPRLARLLRFFPAGETSAALEVHAHDDREVWIRRFGKSIRRTVQTCDSGMLRESFGLLKIWFLLSADETGMRFSAHHARLCGVPAPIRVEAVTRAHGDASWEFEVKVHGLASYRGVMELQP